MTLTFPLVVAALLPALAFASSRCYFGISSPDAINGVYAPFQTDSWKIIDDNGKFGSYVLKKSSADNDDYYFFKDGAKILTKVSVSYDAATKCFADKTNILGAWPKTYLFKVPYPMSGPFLGEIANPSKTKSTTKDTYQHCYYWVKEQADAPTGINWSYNDTCTAVWGGQPANKIAELPNRTANTANNNHKRAQLLHRIPAPGSSAERKFIGKANNMKECLKLAEEEGAAVKMVAFHKSGKCYYSGISDYEVDTKSDDWSYFPTNIAAKPFTLTSFTCS